MAAGLLERISAERSAVAVGVERRFSVDQWISDYLIPSGGLFGYGGNQYSFGLNQTYDRQRVQQIPQSLPGYSSALRSSPPAFAAQLVRAMVLSQARFVYRNPPWHRTPRRVFGGSSLRLLERPWRGATTGELLSRMEWHAGLAGNAYVVRQPTRLRVIRPDWTGVLFGSELEPDDPAGALDAELVGYVYQNGGLRAGNNSEPMSLLPSDVAHWSPIPDPEIPEMGQSWVTATLREIQGDTAATEHKLNFFRNGATPNMVVKGLPAVTREQFNDMVDMLEERHTGLSNAYKTLYLVAGADATVVGADLKQIDFKQTQGAGETRIALVGRVPAALLGISEGLAGSTLNQGNFGMARRMFADTWLYPSLQDVAGALAQIVDVPDDAELWFDTADIPLLREDGKDAAEIALTESSAITQYVREGFTPDSSIAAVKGMDIGLLEHTGLVSVQLQPPGTTAPPVRMRLQQPELIALLNAGWSVVKEPIALPAGKNGEGSEGTTD